MSKRGNYLKYHKYPIGSWRRVWLENYPIYLMLLLAPSFFALGVALLLSLWNCPDDSENNQEPRRQETQQRQGSRQELRSYDRDLSDALAIGFATQIQSGGTQGIQSLIRIARAQVPRPTARLAGDPAAPFRRVFCEGCC